MNSKQGTVPHSFSGGDRTVVSCKSRREEKEELARLERWLNAGTMTHAHESLCMKFIFCVLHNGETTEIQLTIVLLSLIATENS